MSNSLNSSIDFVSTLKSLGVRLTSNSLPSSGNCPLCESGRLKVFPDRQYGGAWVNCRGCHFSGDLLELTKKAKHCGTAAAMSHLQSNSALKVLADNSAAQRKWESLSNHRENIRQMIATSQRGSRVINDPAARGAMAAAGYAVESHLSWSPRGLGQVIGYASADDIEESIRVRKATSPKRFEPRSRKILSSDALAALVLPYYDLPGRVASVSLFESVATGKHIIDYAVESGKHGIAEGGIAGHPDLFKGRDDQKLLLTPDTHTYMLMSARAFRRQPKPLSLLAYREGDTPTTDWTLVAGRPMVFWYRNITPQRLANAVKLDAKITVFGPRQATIGEYLSRRDPSDVAYQCFKHAKHWSEVLGQLIDTKSRDDLADFLCEMDLSVDRKDALIAGTTASRKSQLEAALEGVADFRSVPVSGGFVEQKSTGWWFTQLNKPACLITDAPFRILHATEHQGEVSYRVQVTYQGKQFDFSANDQELKKDPFKLVLQEAIRKGQGVPTSDPTWRSKACHISKQLHTPKVLATVKTVGILETGEVVLPQFSISRRGELKTQGCGVADHLPGIVIRDAYIDPAPLAELYTSPTYASHRSAILAIGTQMLSLLKGKPLAIAAAGPSIRRSLQDVCQAIGSLSFQQATGKSLTQAKTHRWPVAMCLAGVTNNEHAKQAINRDDVPLVFPVSELQSIYTTLTDRHLVARSKNYTTLDADLSEVLSPLLMQFLATAIRDGSWQAANNTHALNDSASRTLSRVLQRFNVTVDDDRKTLKTIITGHNAAYQLASATVRLANRNILEVSQTESDVGKGYIGRLTGRGVVAVPKQKFFSCFAQAGCPMVDLQDLISRLATSPIPCGLQLIAGKHCFAIDIDQYARAERDVKYQLRLAS